MPSHADICGAASQMVRARDTAYGLVHCLRAVTAVDDDGVVALSIATVPFIAQHFQPAAKALQVLNMYVRRDVFISGLRTGLAELPQREMWR